MVWFAPESTCACDVCKSFCETRPCWPTPDEAKRLIEAGFADHLTLDWEHIRNIGKVEFIYPAVSGWEGQIAPEEGWPIKYRRCTMLTPERLCSLHDLGLKPLEGRVAHHDGNVDVRPYIFDLWNTDEGREVVKQFKKLIGQEE